MCIKQRGRTLLLATALAAVGAVGAWAQQNCPGNPGTNCGGFGDAALVPISVVFQSDSSQPLPAFRNDSVLVKAQFAGMTDQAFEPIYFWVKPNIVCAPCSGPQFAEDTLRLPLNGVVTGIRSGAQARRNSPAIISNRAGKVTVNLSAQSYKNAEVSLYAVNGKRIMREKVSASNTANSISRRNVTAGVYMLSVKGADGNAAASRLTHRGGNLNIGVSFAGENLSPAPQLSKKASEPDGSESLWTITVRAAWYTDTSFAIRPSAGMNERLSIFLRPTENQTFYKVTTSDRDGGATRGGGLYREGETVTISAEAAEDLVECFVGTWACDGGCPTWDGATVYNLNSWTNKFIMPPRDVTAESNFFRLMCLDRYHRD